MIVFLFLFPTLLYLIFVLSARRGCSERKQRILTGLPTAAPKKTRYNQVEQIANHRPQLAALITQSPLTMAKYPGRILNGLFFFLSSLTPFSCPVFSLRKIVWIAVRHNFKMQSCHFFENQEKNWYHQNQFATFELSTREGDVDPFDESFYHSQGIVYNFKKAECAHVQ